MLTPGVARSKRQDAFNADEAAAGSRGKDKRPKAQAAEGATGASSARAPGLGGSRAHPVDLDAVGASVPGLPAAKVRTFFSAIDVSGCGLITTEAILQAAERMALPLAEGTAQAMVDHFDRGGKGGLDFGDFEALLQRRELVAVCSMLTGAG